ncbi:sarcosine oxidase subunit delta [Thiohalorhabdus methylotrophus]|uniref:Sarcosine oxidase subunit delta n=1 Tax=Thiohalorhabdus methylotrophus TaxID=3242694 RepID=A0ABV4TQW9_9GAMM
MRLIEVFGLGKRPASELDYGGEARPPSGETETGSIGTRVFPGSGGPGVRREWWFHRPTGRWLVFERDTGTDRFLRQIPLAEVRRHAPA